MDSVIIATKDKDEAQQLTEIIKKEFNATQVSSPENFQDSINGTSLILLDQNFTDMNSLDFLSNTLKSQHMPILYMAGPDDGDAAYEALKKGACNIVHKVPNYHKVLYFLTKKAIADYNEKQKLYRGIKILKKKVEDSEGNGKEDGNIVQNDSDSGEIKGDTLLEQILSVFNKGEIDLPSPPQIGIKFRKLLEKKANLQQVGDLLSKDIAISSKLISISNSAFYKGMVENKNLTQAINRLGVDVTKQYVEAILNRSLYITKNKAFAAHIESLWQHSLSCAYASQMMKEELALNLGEDAFTLGLLHDIGKLVLFRVISELQMKNKLDSAIDTSEVLDTVEKNHHKFGGLLLKVWKFPEEYIRVSVYHDDMEASDPISKELMVVNFANQLVKSIGYGQKEDMDMDLSSLESASLLELDGSKILAVKEKLTALMGEVGGFLT